MNMGTFELLAFAFPAAVAGIFFLVSIVSELAPAERRKWLLGIGLGSGIIAFCLKIVLIVTFNNFSTPILDMLPEQKYSANPIIDAVESTPRAAHKSYQKSVYTWETLPEIAPSPLNNPTTKEKVALGKQLFFDKRLSADGTLSCASCHEISSEKGGADGLAHSIGIDGQTGDRNAPTVLNAAFQRVLFWDGRASSLEEQAKGPLVNPVEMGMLSLQAVQEKVATIPDYQQSFAQVFSETPAINIDNIAKAIAAYERTLITPDSPYDRFVKGDSNALSQQQLRGMALFESTGCVLCHSGPNFSGASIYGNDAVYRLFPAKPDTLYETKYRLTQDRGAANKLQSSGRGIWRIPSLRNVSRTAPYFHNGSVDSLEEAVRIMAFVQLDRTLSNEITDDKKIQWSRNQQQLNESTNQALSDAEVKDIVAFLSALNGEVSEQWKM